MSKESRIRFAEMFQKFKIMAQSMEPFLRFSSFLVTTDIFLKPEKYEHAHPSEAYAIFRRSVPSVVNGMFLDEAINLCLVYKSYEKLGLSVQDIMNLDYATYAYIRSKLKINTQETSKMSNEISADAEKIIKELKIK